MKYLVNYRYTHETVDEVNQQLKAFYPNVTMFNMDEVYFLIEDVATIDVVAALLNEHFPLSLRSLTPGQ